MAEYILIITIVALGLIAAFLIFTGTLTTLISGSGDRIDGVDAKKYGTRKLSQTEVKNKEATLKLDKAVTAGKSGITEDSGATEAVKASKNTGKNAPAQANSKVRTGSAPPFKKYRTNERAFREYQEEKQQEEMWNIIQLFIYFLAILMLVALVFISIFRVKLMMKRH